MNKKLPLLLALAALGLAACGGESVSSSADSASSGDSVSDPATGFALTANYSSSEVTVTGLNSAYEAGDSVNFTITKAESLYYKLVNLDFEGLSVYSYDQATGAGAFVMPRNEVAMTITLVDEASYPVSVIAPEQVTVSGLEDSYAPGTHVSFTASVNDPEYAIESVTATGADIVSGSEAGTYEFDLSQPVEITIAVIQLSSEISGEGTSTSPYLISNSAQLMHLQENIAAGKLSADGIYELVNDIDLVGAKWNPIGTLSSPFNGGFDGNGHVIKGLKITETASFEAELYGASYAFHNAGFFAEASGAYIHDLTIEDAVLDIDFTGLTVSETYIGGVVGNASNTYFEDVHASYSQFDVAVPLSNIYVMVGGIVGYYASSGSDSGNTYVDLVSSSFEGNIDVDTTGSDGLSTMVGGLVGRAYSRGGDNLVSVNNSYFKGSISGGTMVGGLVGLSDVYTSILSSYAVGESISASDDTGAYVGGIIGQASYDNLVMDTFVSFDSISAPASTTSYKSFAGAIAGYSYDEYFGYEAYSAILGTGFYNNFHEGEPTISSDNVGENGTKVDTLEGLFTEKIPFSTSVWDVTGELPVHVSSPASSYKVDVVLDSNGGVEEDVALSGQTAGIYSYDFVVAAMNQSFTKAISSYNGLYYDEAGTVAYRWYAPLTRGITLYAKYTDLTDFMGQYTYECVYYERVVGTGIWYFDETTFYWENDDNEVFAYEYALLDNYILTGDAIPAADGKEYGDYYDQVLVVEENGTITLLDNNDNDAVYTATKVAEGTWSKPDYTGMPYLGTWYLSDQTSPIILYYDGLATGTRTYSYGDSTPTSYEVTGAFRATGTTLDIYVSMIGLNHEIYSYDAPHDLLIASDGTLGAREAVTATYATVDGSLHLHIVGEENNVYVIENGSVSATSYEGTLAEGETIVINGTSYVVNGSTLVVPSEPVEPVDPVDPDPSTNIPWYCGTWEGKVGINNVTIVLNSDLTASYNGTETTYTLTDNVITYTVGVLTVTITLNEASQSIAVSVYDDDMYETYEGSGFTQTAKEEASSSEGEVTLAGTYTWSDHTLVIADDNTATVNGTAVELTVGTDGTIAFSFEVNYTLFEMSVTQDADGNLTGTFAQDYEGEYPVTWTKTA